MLPTVHHTADSRINLAWMNRVNVEGTLTEDASKGDYTVVSLDAEQVRSLCREIANSVPDIMEWLRVE